MNDLPIIQKTYDLIKWYVPILNRLPKTHKYLLGDRIISGLYDFLEGLILAQYSREKIGRLQKLNAQRTSNSSRLSDMNISARSSPISASTWEDG